MSKHKSLAKSLSLKNYVEVRLVLLKAEIISNTTPLIQVTISFIFHNLKGAPFPEVLQYRVDAWSERSKPLFHLPELKIGLICSPRIEDISDIKLIRTDTTLDLSQKAEKR